MTDNLKHWRPTRTTNHFASAQVALDVGPPWAHHLPGPSVRDPGSWLRPHHPVLSLRHAGDHTGWNSEMPLSAAFYLLVLNYRTPHILELIIHPTSSSSEISGYSPASINIAPISH